MGKGTASRDEAPKFKRRNYVAVVDTNDEWEDLIGKIDEFMDANGTLVPEWSEGCRAVVFFPTLREDIAAADLVSVNQFTSFVREHLKRHQNQQVFEITNLELVNPDDL